MGKLYERDYYGWANEQAALLRAGNLGAADIGNIAEEIESMGKGEKRELVNRLAVLLLHLLKWQFQPGKRSKSWQITIRAQRTHIARHLAENPSLKAQLGQAMLEAYSDATLEAERETDLPDTAFPATCPYSFEVAMQSDFWPKSSTEAGA